MKSELLERYKFKIELHAHSNPISACSQVSAKELIELYRDTGINSVVLTNHFFSGYFTDGSKEEKIHNYIFEWHQAREYGEKFGVSVILGMEIRFTENINDYLVYGIDEADVYRAYDYLTEGIETFYQEFKNDKNVILQAHPFRDNMFLADAKSIDGIEVFNMHPDHNSRVAVAAKYAKEHDFLICGGTDFHNRGVQGLCLIRTEREMKNSFDIAQTIKNRDFIFDISGNLVLP